MEGLPAIAKGLRQHIVRLQPWGSESYICIRSHTLDAGSSLKI